MIMPLNPLSAAPRPASAAVSGRPGRFPLLSTAVALVSLCVPSLSAEIVQSDLCVYGATSGGVAAAVQAARMGKSVVVVEPGRHVGGMTSGGLGMTDTGNTGTIGGVSREFYRRVGQYYGAAESFRFEPHVAEAVFKAMLKEQNIPVYYQQTLSAVVKEGRRITEMSTSAGVQFRAKMFLDTTYEGDLLAAAGVRYTVGREATNTFAETLNGIRPSTPSHQFLLGVDPYVVPGDSASGLLPLIQSEPPGAPGQGDSRVQAYNFRLCLTQVETNKLPVAPPPGYDPARFELLGRYIQARVAAGHTFGLDSFLKIDSMPNGKTDINNNGAISTDYIGMSYTYPTNTPAQRALIWTDHENYIRGLLTFLGADARVPAAIRASMQSWGLCRDEFQDTGGWPHQMYVREARRMVSDYIITQADCDALRVPTDSVGLASYNMDSHNCQRHVVSNCATNEGDVQRAPAGPFPISYRAIVPSTNDCENLFATFCLSGTHIAFSSCRMEPVFMITSQSAAAAAAIAIDDNVPVQNVSYAKLRLHMVAAGQVLTWGSAAVVSTNSIVLDSEMTTNAVTLSGSWTASSANPGYNGINYMHDANTGKGTKSVRYTPNLPAAGRYTVSLKWPQNANRATNVPITVTFSGGATNIPLNQRATGNAWIAIGTFPFEAGNAGNVLLATTGTESGYVIADGVMWAPAAEALQASVEVISPDSVASEDGANPALFALVRTGDASNALTVNYTLSGTATPGVDYPAASGSLLIPPGQAMATVTIDPVADTLAEGDESVVITLAPGAGYSIGACSNASAVIHDGGYGLWCASQFDAAQLALPAVSGPAADPDADGQLNLLEFFQGTNPTNATPGTALSLAPVSGGWTLDWLRNPAASGLFTRVETSADLAAWSPAPFDSQFPLVTESAEGQRLSFPIPSGAAPAAREFFRVAVSPTMLPLLTNDAICFFSFDTSVDGSNSFIDTPTAAYGFRPLPVISRTGTVLADAGGAASYTDFTGVTWLGSGGAATPGHSLTFNNGSANNSLSLSFSTLGLGQIRLRMDIRSAAQAGGVAPAAFTSMTYDIGSGPQPVPGATLAVTADNAFHEWTADFSSLPAINNQRKVTLTWTVKTLQMTPAESFRMDNLQLTASPFM